jgi:sulfatase modifying factor 1
MHHQRVFGRVGTMGVAAVFLLLSCPRSSQGQPAALQLDLGGGTALEVRLLQGGKFTQGSPEAESGRGADEASRGVTLTKPFYVATTAVTRAQWERFVAETHYRTEAEGGTSGGYGWDGKALTQRKEFTWRNPGFAQTGDHPVCLVTYPDAEAFCKWLSDKSGRTVTLPTEAQWEYACRAGTTTPWHNGAADATAAAEVAWSKQTADNATHPVTSRQPNAWGLYIGGNVSEWCQDWYGPYPAGPATDPVQATPPAGDKARRVLRGGSWNRDVKQTRSAARYRADPRSRNADTGFRVVATVDATGAAHGTPAPQATDRTPAVPAEAVASEPLASPGPPAGDAGGSNDPSGGHAAYPAAATPDDGPFSRWAGGLCGVGGVTCGLAGLGGLAYLVIRMLKGTGGSATARPASGAMVRLDADGFWLVLPNVPPGSRVRYTFRPAGGGPQSDSVVYNPGPQGQFIYTGQRPESARVLDFEPGDGGSGASSLASGFGVGSGSRSPTSSIRPTRTSASSSISSTSRGSSHRRPSAY